MGFFIDNNYSEKLKFENNSTVKYSNNDTSAIPITRSEDKLILGKNNAIRINNNESIIFDLRVYTMFLESDHILCEDTSTTNLNYMQFEDGDNIEMEASSNTYLKDMVKFYIDFGDGTTIKKVSPIKNIDKDWALVEHRFTFGKDIDENNNKNMVIKIYSLDGTCHHYEMSYTVSKISTVLYGLNLELVSANITNNKDISYVFNDINKDQLIICKNKNN